MIITYTIYVTLSIALTIWVATTLFRNGQVFLVVSFGSVKLADAVNRLLVVGFYLVNVGFMALFLRYGDKPHGAVESIEFIATKVGVVLLVLGLWHFLNMINIAKIFKKRKKAMRTRRNPKRSGDEENWNELELPTRDVRLDTLLNEAKASGDTDPPDPEPQP